VIDRMIDEEEEFPIMTESPSYSEQAPPWYVSPGSPTGYVGFSEAS